MSAINFCPPKPGSTVITRIISTFFTYGKTVSTEVPGRIAMPTYDDEEDEVDVSRYGSLVVSSGRGCRRAVCP